ncbi:hypothetical protein GTA08_BOTSDO10924 [Botryosphaeria dothidea]|uniref:Cell wall protein n=1 Tax=Botryosphaeria dothidea TaxID=55169 RepID=A0A8H4N0C3_9PEZI|nr:hypothetical protein GTA08_BOTSDO10924 [Botryosphaeria dothidea]
MLYNIRAAFTAALAFLAVPSIANPDAAQIIASLNGLSSELTDLKTTCSSDGSQGGKGGYIGGGGGGAGFSFGAISGGFNNIISTTQTTYTLIQKVRQQQITYSQEEAAEIYKAWTDVLNTQQEVLNTLRSSLDIFSQIVGILLGSLQQIQGLFGQITQTLVQIVPSQKIDIFEIWQPVQNDFSECLSTLGTTQQQQNFQPTQDGGIGGSGQYGANGQGNANQQSTYGQGSGSDQYGGSGANTQQLTQGGAGAGGSGVVGGGANTQQFTQGGAGAGGSGVVGGGANTQQFTQGGAGAGGSGVGGGGANTQQLTQGGAGAGGSGVGGGGANTQQLTQGGAGAGGSGVGGGANTQQFTQGGAGAGGSTQNSNNQFNQNHQSTGLGGQDNRNQQSNQNQQSTYGQYQPADQYAQSGGGQGVQWQAGGQPHLSGKFWTLESGGGNTWNLKGDMINNGDDDNHDDPGNKRKRAFVA